MADSLKRDKGNKKAMLFWVAFLSLVSPPIYGNEDLNRKLSEAIFEENPSAEKIEMLLRKGADPNMVIIAPEKVATPLEYAARRMDQPLHILNRSHIESSDRLRLTQLLILYGADPLAKNKYGETPFHTALGEGHVGLCELYFSKFKESRKLKGYGPQSIGEIEDMVREKGILTIDSLLAHLPEIFRKHYVLIYQSDSLQEGSDEYPRVILFGETGNLILAFNGHPSQKGYNDLEMIEFDWEKLQYKFGEIHFESAVELATFSRDTLQKCAGCHLKSGGGSPNEMRPNWRPYPAWLGTYGSVDDSFGYRASRSKHTRDPESEKAALKKFISRDHTGDRYHFLIDLGKRYSYAYKETETDARPNLELTKVLHLQNSFRIAGQIRRSPQYEKQKFLVQAILRRCSFRWMDVLGKPPQHERENITALLPQSAHNLFDQMLPGLDGSAIYEDLFYLDLEVGTQFTQKGNSLENWTLLFKSARESQHYGLFQDGTTATQLNRFWLYLMLIDPDLKGLECEGLLSKHKEMVRDGPLDIEKSEMPSFNPASYLKNSCMVCHAGSGGPPNLPLNDEAKLGEELKKQIPGSGNSLFEKLKYRLNPETPASERMPLAGPPVTKERYRELMEFLSQLRQTD